MENRNWKEIILGDYLDSISKTFKFTDKEVVFLNTSDVLEGKVLNKKHESPIGLPGQAKKSIQKGDLLFSEIRPANKRYARIDFDSEDYVVSTKLMVLRAKGDLDPIFLELYLTSEEILDYLQMIAEDRSGTFPQITFDIISKLELKLPPLFEQKAIASVLSSLDDKIDLLHQQNQTLEALAETLFRQWFIEEAKEDWEERSLYDSIKLVGGGTPKTSLEEYWNGDISWLSGGDISNSHKSFVVRSEKSITQLGLKNSSAKLLPKFSTVISARGTVGKYCLLAEPMTFSQSNYGVLPGIKDCFFFTYLLIAYSVNELQTAAYGSVFDTITTNTFNSIKLKLPADTSIISFERSIEYYFFKMLYNQQQIQTLTKLRDALLPKLMSGEVKVKM